MVALAKSQDCRECFINAPLLVWRDAADEIAKPSRFNSADLLDQDASSLAEELDLRAKRRRSGAERCRCNEDD